MAFGARHRHQAKKTTEPADPHLVECFFKEEKDKDSTILGKSQRDMILDVPVACLSSNQ